MINKPIKRNKKEQPIYINGGVSLSKVEALIAAVEVDLTALEAEVDALSTDLTNHINNTSNPHSVTIGQISPLTTKADLLTRSATGHVRLPKGANDSLLICRSTTTTGLYWQSIENLWPDYFPEYHKSDDTESYTNSGTPQSKLKFSCDKIVKGTYKLEWYAEVSQDHPAAHVAMDIVEGSTLLGEIWFNAVDHSYIAQPGFIIFEGLDGDHTYEMYYYNKMNDGHTVRIRKARMCLHRIGG